MKPAGIEEFEDLLRRLSLSTQLPLQSLPLILGDIAGVLMQEARTTLFEEREEVTVDPQQVREELLRMGHDGDRLDLPRVRLLVDFFLEKMVDPDTSRN